MGEWLETEGLFAMGYEVIIQLLDLLSPIIRDSETREADQTTCQTVYIVPPLESLLQFCFLQRILL